MAGVTETRVSSGQNSDLVAAGLAGVAAGVVFGVMIQAVLGRMTAIGALYTLGEPNLTIGWVAHLFHSVLFAVVFALVTAGDRFDDLLARPLTGALLGGSFGFALWFVNIGLVWPLWLNAVELAGAPSFPYWLDSLRPLVGHLIWGGLFGGLYAVLR